MSFYRISPDLTTLDACSPDFLYHADSSVFYSRTGYALRTALVTRDDAL